MSLHNSLLIAWRALARNPLRTALTMLGIVIGVGGVIAMVAVGEGTSQRMQASIKAMGTNTLTVAPGNPKIRFGGSSGVVVKTLTEDDAKAITARFRETIELVAPSYRSGGRSKYEEKSWESGFAGVTPAYSLVNNQPIERGRYVTLADHDARAKVCVLGHTVVENLFGLKHNEVGEAEVVGKRILINRNAFQVIGVLKEKGSTAWGQDQDDIVHLPLSTAMRRLYNVDFVNGMALRVKDEKQMDRVAAQVTDFLRERHRLRPPFPDNDDFSVRNQAQFLETARASAAIMTSLLGSIAVVSLIVGGIGIMNIMLVSVSERTREIGLRKAVGATRRHILIQFLIESVTISFAGGLLGVALGYGFTPFARLVGWSFFITPQSVVLAVAVSALIGVVFGVYPARKAAKLHPIQALRFE